MKDIRCIALALAALAECAWPAQMDMYPSKPIRIIVPSSPGGGLGIVQAVLVVFVIWYACMWLCRKLRVDDEFGAMLSTAVWVSERFSVRFWSSGAAPA